MSIVEGYFSNAAKRSNTGGYLTLRGSQNVSIHSTSVLAGARQRATKCYYYFFGMMSS
jgi:hypothetical protein